MAYLNPNRFFCGSWRSQVFPISHSLVGEGGPSHLVVTIPLDGPATIQEVFLGVFTSQSQEVLCFGHLLDLDLTCSSRDQANINITCWDVECLSPAGNNTKSSFPANEPALSDGYTGSLLSVSQELLSSPKGSCSQGGQATPGKRCRCAFTRTCRSSGNPPKEDM